jgi:hypothetical protein
VRSDTEASAPASETARETEKAGALSPNSTIAISSTGDDVAKKGFLYSLNDRHDRRSNSKRSAAV